MSTSTHPSAPKPVAKASRGAKRSAANARMSCGERASSALAQLASSVRSMKASSLLRRGERLVEVFLDVVDVLDAGRDAHLLGRDAGAPLLRLAELLVGRRRGVDDERLRVAHVREVRGELHRVDELLAGLEAALDAEGEHAAEAVPEVLARALVVRVLLEAGVVHPRHLRVALEPARQREGVVDVALPAQGERLEALQELEGVERRQRRPEVAQPLDAGADDELDVAERALRTEDVVEDEAVVARRRIGEEGELARRA